MSDPHLPLSSHKIISSSSLAFLKEAQRTEKYSFFDWLHGYVYARWPYVYIGIGTGEHPLVKKLAPLVAAVSQALPHARQPNDHPTYKTALDAAIPSHTVADGYHGKVVPLESATQLVTASQKVTVNEPIRLPDLEQVIPYVRARDIILHDPDHIVVLQCPCRSSRENPCFPLDVCLIVGEPFASLVAEHHPTRSRWITSEEAVGILRAEDERGHVHHAFFKDAMLGRFYAICNCCSCCCGAMQAQRRGSPMLASSGYVSRVDEDLCIGCGTCAETCQFAAISVVDGFALVDESACMGCGICVSHCDQDALSLQRDYSSAAPLELFRLMEELAL